MHNASKTYCKNRWCIMSCRLRKKHRRVHIAKAKRMKKPVNLLCKSEILFFMSTFFSPLSIFRFMQMRENLLMARKETETKKTITLRKLTLLLCFSSYTRRYTTFYNIFFFFYSLVFTVKHTKRIYFLVLIIKNFHTYQWIFFLIRRPYGCLSLIKSL